MQRSTGGGLLLFGNNGHRAGSALRWEDARRRLVSTPGDVVEFTRDDGPQVRGAGLEADVRRKTIRFSGAVSGTLVTESDGDD